MIYTVYCLCAPKLGFHLLSVCRDSKDISHLIEFQNVPAFHSSPQSPTQKKKGRKWFSYHVRELKQTKRAAVFAWTPVAGCWITQNKAEGVFGRLCSTCPAPRQDQLNKCILDRYLSILFLKASRGRLDNSCRQLFWNLAIFTISDFPQHVTQISLVAIIHHYLSNCQWT